MSNESIFYICATVLIILTIGTPDILDGLISMANGCAAIK
jgi:hypothetical protein